MSAVLALLHSPLLDAASWGEVAPALLALGHRAVVVHADEADAPPYAETYVKEAAGQLAELSGELVLAAHSGAGYLLPALGAELAVRRRPVAGYLFADAGLPGEPGSTRLSLLARESPELAGLLRVHLEEGGRYPTWTPEELRRQVPDEAARERLVAGVRSRGLDFFTEPLPAWDEWPDAPVGYLRLSGGYDGSAARARALGWPTEHLRGGHFWALNDPGGFAEALVRLRAARVDAAR